MRTADITWIAGLVEGEGCFTTIGQGAKQPRILVSMTDEDVVARLASLWGSNLRGPYLWKKAKPHHKPMFSTLVTGRKAMGWCFTLWPYLGKRRREKILELRQLWMEPRARPWQKTRRPKTAPS